MDNFSPYYQTGAKGASRTYEALTRAQWDDYLRTFVPAENDLISYAMDPAQLQQSADVARLGVQQSFEQQQGIDERRMRAQGVTLTPEEQAVRERKTGLNAALSEVNAGNLATRRTQDRQQSIMGNPVPTATGM